MSPSIDDQIQILARRCERILTEEDLRKKLQRSAKTGKQLRVKLGMDPTAPDVTLGHVVPLSVVRQFQDWGHKAVLIIGDYTARVGDPTGRNKMRPMLSGEEIDRNAETYVAQVGKVLLTDPDHLEVRRNGEWLAKMTLMDVIKLASRATVAQMLTREDFAKRFNESGEIRVHEIMYPLMQGWDSVQVEADVEMGGSDQLFNNLVGREFQKEQGSEGQVVIVTPLLVGTDGVKKMSKSVGNYIGVTDPPGGTGGMFGKVMSLPDSVMEMYYTLLTDLPVSDFKSQMESNPRDAKVRLAKRIITRFHDAESADRAEQEFVRTTHHGLPDEIPEMKIGAGPHKLAQLLAKAGLVPSNSEGIRKLKEGAVKINGEKVLEFNKEFTLTEPVVLQLGNRKFVRLIPE
jgi:tyrosyl-tRNA synthetase